MFDRFWGRGVCGSVSRLGKEELLVAGAVAVAEEGEVSAMEGRGGRSARL
jgi:hypothetical protein